jgi:hypothetical protein
MKNPFLLLLLTGLLIAGCSTVSSSSSFPLQYKNADYGFAISLPTSWQGFAVLQETWQGHHYAGEPQGDIVVERGPTLIFRHPQWVANDPYQDIPIYVFTINQWDAMQRDGFSIHAGGLEDEIYRNTRFVFVTHNRDFWTDGMPKNKEAMDIIANLMSEHPEAAGRRGGG